MDPSKIDVTIGLNRTESFGWSYAEPMSTMWRITLLLNFPGQEWAYVNVSTAAPVSLGRSTQFNMTLDSTYFGVPWNITVDSVSITNTYSSGNVFFPLGVVHVNTRSVNLDLPYNAANTFTRLLKLRQILIQNILLLSGLTNGNYSPWLFEEWHLLSRPA